MTRADGTTPAAVYVQALTNGASEQDAYLAAYHGNKQTTPKEKQ